MVIEDLKVVITDLEQEQQIAPINVELVDIELAIVFSNSNKSQVNIHIQLCSGNDGKSQVNILYSDEWSLIFYVQTRTSGHCYSLFRLRWVVTDMLCSDLDEWSLIFSVQTRTGGHWNSLQTRTSGHWYSLFGQMVTDIFCSDKWSLICFFWIINVIFGQICKNKLFIIYICTFCWLFWLLYHNYYPYRYPLSNAIQWQHLVCFSYTYST